MGLVSRLRRIVFEERRVTVSVEASPFLRMRLERAVEALSKVLIPGYDVDLVSSGVASRIRVSMDGSRVAVWIDYTGSNPGCSFCRFINDNLWKKILGDAEEALHDAGFREIIFLDSATGRPLALL